MRGNLLSYWRQWENNSISIPLEPNSFLIYYKIINENSNEYYSDWISCSSKEKLLTFIKYVLIPSTHISRIIGLEDNSIYFGVYDYYETLEILKNSEIGLFQLTIRKYIEHYQLLEKIEGRGCNIDEIIIFLDKFHCDITRENGVFAEIDVFSNLKEVGYELVKSYEECGMINQLEKKFKLKSEEIVELFKGIDNNPFMIRRIKEYLINNLE